jgi:hypothetical protein
MLYGALLFCPIWTADELLLTLIGKSWHPASVPSGLLAHAFLLFLLDFLAPLTRRALVLACRPLPPLSLWLRAARGRLPRHPHLPLRFYASVFAALFALAAHTQVLARGVRSGSPAYLDLLYHFGIVSSIVRGVNRPRSSLWPCRAVFCANASLLYPVVPDFHSAAFVIAGASLRNAVLVPGLLFALSLFALLHFFAARLSRTLLVPELALLLFTLAAGSGWRGGPRELGAAVRQLHAPLGACKRLLAPDDPPVPHPAAIGRVLAPARRRGDVLRRG